MFYGEYPHILDAKGRVIMPSKFRNDLGDSFIITKGLEKCLFVFDLREWEILSKKMREQPITDESSRKFMRFFFGGAAECDCDTQGRVIIPQHLRDYAELAKSVVSLGMINRIEIWSRDRLNEFNEQADYSGSGMAELAAKMAMLGV